MSMATAGRERQRSYRARAPSSRAVRSNEAHRVESVNGVWLRVARRAHRTTDARGISQQRPPPNFAIELSTLSAPCSSAQVARGTWPTNTVPQSHAQKRCGPHVCFQNGNSFSKLPFQCKRKVTELLFNMFNWLTPDVQGCRGYVRCCVRQNSAPSPVILNRRIRHIVW